MRHRVQIALQVLAGGVLGFVLTLGALILSIRVHLAHHPLPPGVGQVYGVIAPSLAGFLIGGCAVGVVRLRQSPRRKTLRVPPVD